MSDCECFELFPEETRRYAICTGEADMPLERINTYRVRWGLDPLPDDGRERPARVIHSGKPIAKPKASATAKHAPCGTCSGKPKDQDVRIISKGPGTELIYHHEALGIPVCKLCRERALEMDALGPEGCEREMERLVEDILPRAREHVDKMTLGKLAPDAAIRWEIRRQIRRAIVASQKPPEWTTIDCSDLLSQTEIVVKSFKRHDLLMRFVKSVRRHYPTLPTRIVDDSGEPEKSDPFSVIPFITWHDLPFDSGLPAGRNYGVGVSSAKYILLCDDDYEFTAETKIEALLLALAETDLDLCGGLVKMDGETPQNWCGNLHWKGTGKRRWLSMTRCPERYERHRGIRIQRSDITYNFFAARRKFLINHPWDERYKITNEHIDSFTSWWQAGAKIGFTPDCICSHQPQTANKDYKRFRRRNATPIFLDKWKITEKRTIGVTKFEVRT